MPRRADIGESGGASRPPATNVVERVETFPATREAALARLAEFAARAPRYAAERNRVERGHANVSRLSAAIRHRLITEAEVVEEVMRRHPFHAGEKFVQEVLWRNYWKGWLEMRPRVWERYRESARAGMDETCMRVADGLSGAGVMDHFARELRETGYLHNHARMWWASFWIHHCGLPWELGARHFFAHLLDADPASNTLGWRWVAGLQTRGKAYVATEQNIRKFCTPDLLESAGGIGLTAHASAQVPEDDGAGNGAPEAPATHASEAEDTNVPTALLLHDEDLCLEVGATARLRPAVVLQLLPEAAPAETPARARWLEAARSDAARRAHDHFRCEVRQCGTREDLRHTCQSQGVARLVMMEPFVGPLHDELRTLPDELAAVGMRVERLRRRWDTELLPHASRGFFPFWNQVAPRLKKHGAQFFA